MCLTLGLDTGGAQARRNLQCAARIGGGDDRRPGCLDVPDLARLQALRHLGFGEIVDTGAPAADRAFIHLHQLEARNLFQQPARRGADALRMHQMARLLVGHACIDPSARRC